MDMRMADDRKRNDDDGATTVSKSIASTMDAGPNARKFFPGADQRHKEDFSQSCARSSRSDEVGAQLCEYAFEL